MKQMSTPPFWGVFCEVFGVFSSSSIQSPIFCHLKKGTFDKSAHFWVPKNGTKITRIEKTISKWILPKYFGEPSYLLSN